MGPESEAGGQAAFNVRLATEPPYVWRPANRVWPHPSRIVLPILLGLLCTATLYVGRIVLKIAAGQQHATSGRLGIYGIFGAAPTSSHSDDVERRPRLVECPPRLLQPGPIYDDLGVRSTSTKSLHYHRD